MLDRDGRASLTCSHPGWDEAFRYETIESEELVLDGIRARVATPAMLYRMKKDTVRPQDRVDAQSLRQMFELGDD